MERGQLKQREVIARQVGGRGCSLKSINNNCSFTRMPTSGIIRYCSSGQVKPGGLGINSLARVYLSSRYLEKSRRSIPTELRFENVISNGAMPV